MRVALLVLLAGCDALFLQEKQFLLPPDAPDNEPDVSPTAPCPPMYGAEAYVFSTSSEPWPRAQMLCEQLRTTPDQKYSYLAVISDDTEHTTLQAMLGTAHRWIGLTNLRSQFGFVWINGEAANIPWNEAAGQPNDGTVACGRLTTLGIHDTQCNVAYRFICECSHLALKRELF